MSNQSFKVKNGLTLSPIDLTTLLSPQAGDLACDINDNNKIKRYDALSASWVEVGSGAAGDVDTLLVQDFDSASLSTFTQTGLTLITVNPLDGRQSARLIHDTPITGVVRSFKETVSVSPKFRGVNMTASLLLRSSASQGNVTIQFRDETNSVDYPSQQLQTNSQVIASLVTNSTTTVSGFSNSVINSLKVGMSVTGSGIPTGTTIASINSSALTMVLSQAATASATVSLRFSDLPRTIQLGFQIPANCSSYSYTISALQEAGSPETYVDDIVLKNYWLGMSNQGQSSTQIEVPVETDWQPATFTGSWTTNTTYSGLYKRSGSMLEAQVRVSTSGAPNATPLTITLPSGFQIDTSKISSTTFEQGFGFGTVNDSNSAGYDTTVSYANATTIQPLVKAANAAYTQSSANINATVPITWGAGDSLFVTFRVPIQGWTATETQSFITNDLVPAKAVLGNTSLEIPSITGWQGYTPTFQGFGTPTNVEFEWRQVGENIEIRGKFDVGSVSGVEARVGLPSGLSSAGTSLIPSLTVAGDGTTDYFSSLFYRVQVLMEPSVSYVTFSRQTSTSSGLTKIAGSQLADTVGQTISLVASVPCAGLSATEQVVVSGTQSALVQEADSYLRINGFTPVVGSTATRILTLISATYNQNIGDAIQYLDDAVNGARFIAQKEGLYRFEFSADSHTTAGLGIGFSKNTSSTTTFITAIPASEKIAVGYDTGSNNIVHVFGEAYLAIGDIIRLHTDGVTSGANSQWSTFTASYQGKLKQLNVSSDQKITIPTSELRFEGASARGTGTETAIVQFSSLAKLRGDAFTVDNSNGTAITIRKAGKLDVSASLRNSNGSCRISKNQAIRTALPTASETLAAESGVGLDSSLAWSGFVSVGDIIRVCADNTPTSATGNQLNLSFQEQDIAVSVTNILPQFSESDSCVRLDTANGYGSTATKIRRFSNVRENLGSDISYVDSAVDGASFTVRSAGIYHISYTDQAVGGTSCHMGITLNENDTTTNISTLILNSNNNVLAYNRRYDASGDLSNLSSHCGWSGYLQKGDVIRAHTNGVANVDIDSTKFTISKVGKPNVTGVDVTPFVNVPQPVTENYVASLNSSIQPSTIIKSTNSSLFTVSTPVVNRIRFTALKNISVNASGALSFTAANPGATAQWYLNGTTLLKFNQNYASAGSIEVSAEASVEIQLSTGDYIEFLGNQYVAGTFAKANVSVIATALSDQILTAPETFSTDTASLRYANASEYTLSTLQNAPVGTYITFTYAANTNTRTQTTTRPTQTDADMNVNGMLIYTRVYNAASTAGNPAAIAIQIGKGLKGKSLDLYKSAGKVNAGDLDYYESGSGASGALLKVYNEATGILLVDAGIVNSTVTSSHSFSYSDTSGQPSGYLVINASKNPALTGVPLLQPRIATLSDVKASGTAGGTATSGSYQTRTLNTLSDPTGIVTSLASNQFTLPAGEYYIDANAFAFNCELHKIRIQNITDSSTALLGAVAYSRVVSNAATTAFLSGNIVITSAKTFELQHRVGATQASTGFGLATSFGDNEVYANIKITKVK